MRWGITVGILLGGVGCATLGLAYALICAAVAFVFTVVATYRDERRVTDDG